MMYKSFLIYLIFNDVFRSKIQFKDRINFVREMCNYQFREILPLKWYNFFKKASERTKDIFQKI